MKRTLMMLTLCWPSQSRLSRRAASNPQPIPSGTADRRPDPGQICSGHRREGGCREQTSRVSKGSFEIPAVGATGTAEIFEKARIVRGDN